MCVFLLLDIFFIKLKVSTILNLCMSVHVLRKVYWHTSVKYCIAKHLFRSKSLYILRAFIFNSCFFSFLFLAPSAAAFFSIYLIFIFLFFATTMHFAFILGYLLNDIFFVHLFTNADAFIAFILKIVFILKWNWWNWVKKWNEKNWIVHIRHIATHFEVASTTKRYGVWIAKLNEYKAIQ